jgi:hypothetical protein
MKRSWKVAAAGAALTAVMATSGAFAAVANTSQKGSLLIYARIDVRPGFDTIVRMSNDNNAKATVKCYYMNEVKGRTDFEFDITKKQPVWWSVQNGFGSITVNKFPTDVVNTLFSSANSPFVGELKCWAVDRTGFNTISFNHLSGNATVYDFNTGTAFQYNSWNFRGNAALNAVLGVPGVDRLVLDGTPNNYDACPQYLIAHYSPAGATLDSGGGAINVHSNDLSIVSCNQDLRQDFTPYWTKLELTSWNEYEVKFTGAWECSNGYHFFDLTTADKVPEVHTIDVLKTNAALLMVEGVASSRCNIGVVTRASGLVGVISTFTSTEDVFEDTHNQRIGTTLNAAGSRAGFIDWDSQPIIIPEKR